MRTFLKNANGLASCDVWEPGCWINLINPTPEEKDYLIDELRVPASFYNDIEDVDERPRIEDEDGWNLIILRVPIKVTTNGLPFSTIPFGIIFKDDILVTICFYQTEMIPDFINYTNRKKIFIRDNYDFVFRLLLSSSVWFLKYLKQLNQEIKSAEKELERSIRNEDLQTLLRIEKCLVFFTTSLKGNDILIHRLKNLKVPRAMFDTELIEDAEIELKQALETANVYSDILSGMMDAYASVISNNLNVIMKVLTSISIILMIPTLIASLYGMNVPHSLESNPYGFLLVIVGSFLLSGIGVLLFRKKNWF